MEENLQDARETTKFTCPRCKASAFEITGTDWGQGGDAEREFVVMRCIGCHQVFRHEMTGFTCPHCKASAFEITGTVWGHGRNGVDKEFLMMKCLGCLEVFTHELVASHMQPAEDPQAESEECLKEEG